MPVGTGGQAAVRKSARSQESGARSQESGVRGVGVSKAYMPSEQ